MSPEPRTTAVAGVDATIPKNEVLAAAQFCLDFEIQKLPLTPRKASILPEFLSFKVTKF